MIRKTKNHLPAAAFALFSLAGPFAQAHPGAPGHTHYPDEVDEFDRTVAVMSESRGTGDFDLGGILVLTLIAGSLGFALFQKDGGIWSDATTKH